jgi:hypothetical protein
VARAKSTDRAEARRKYRAYLQAQEEAAAAANLTDDSPTAAASKPARTGQRPAQPGQPVGRMSMLGAARAAYRNPTYVDDVRHIGDLVFRSKAVWPVLLVCVAGAVYMSARVGAADANKDPILPAVYQFLFYPVPLLPPMIAGFFAPRATWLAGGIAAFIATMSLVVVVTLNSGTFSNTTGELFASPSPVASGAVASVAPSQSALVASASASAPASASATPAASASASAAGSTAPGAAGAAGNTGTPSKATFGDVLNLALMLLVQSLGFGALIGALSGWYKRFLSMTSAANSRPSSRGGSRPSQRRPARTATRR